MDSDAGFVTIYVDFLGNFEIFLILSGVRGFQVLNSAGIVEACVMSVKFDLCRCEKCGMKLWQRWFTTIRDKILCLRCAKIEA